MQPSPFDANNTKGKYLSQGQERMIRSALTNILANAEILQRKPGLTQEEKGSLEGIKKHTYGIVQVLRQSKAGPQVRGKLIQTRQEVEKQAQRIMETLDRSTKLLHGVVEDLEGGLKD